MLLNDHIPRETSCEDEGRASAEECFALDAATLATLLQISLRHLRRLDAAGKLPRPVKLGRAVRWPVSEIRTWLDAGCPDRETWEAMKRAVN